jgi:carboxypeptidase Taq
MSESYVELLERMRQVATLNSVANLLSWDQETMMPPKAGEFRAEALASVGRLAHEHATDPRVGELLAACEADRTLGSRPETRANLREMRRDYDRAIKLPSDLVAEMSEVSSRALEVWKTARAASDFPAFRPWLERQVDLARRKAACYGVPAGGEAYDALLDEYEPGTTAVALEGVFGPLRAELTPLLAEVATARPPDESVRALAVPLDRQRAVNAAVLERIGFDAAAGRLDVSTHPFSTGIAPFDTRITTRYKETDFADALNSTLHEAGHALYEQGVPAAAHWGEPLGEPLGLGVHESQSRLWENHVGRSLAFWRFVRPIARAIVGPDLDRFSAEDLFRAVNVVRSGFIRVESDEATYNLHVMLRFDLERAMLSGDLPVSDLPQAWNERIRRDLGLAVPDDAHGCLQDIHWSMGAIGYFPTYTLGTLYAAQLWEAIGRAIPDIEATIERGEFGTLLGWLRDNVHSHGRRYPASELCLRLTGAPLGHAPLLRHLRAKLGAIYGLASR